MGNSLFDQLKKTGLVDEKRARKAAKEKQKKDRQQRNPKTRGEDESKARARQAQAQQAERDRELNRQRRDDAERKAIAAQIRQLIELNRVQDREGDVPYNFTDKGKVKRIYISETIQGQLSRGRLVIVKLGEAYELVPTPVAEKIRQRDESGIIVSNQPQAVEDEDDPYADYKIPDDLMW